jgi:flagellin
MSELKSMSLDVIKSPADVANYNVEFEALQQQLHSIASEKFNGVSLFGLGPSAGGANLVFGAGVVNVTIFTSDQGGSGAVVSLSKGLLLSALNFNSTTNMANIAAGTAGKSLANDSATAKVDISELSIGFFTKALENVATLRATNAAGMARLQLSEDHARLTKANLEAANSRIMDVDVAEESTRFAKYNILTQASAAMLSQANQSSSTALLLL